MSLSRRSADVTRLRSGDEGGESKDWGARQRTKKSLAAAAAASRSGDEASESGGWGPGLNEAVVLAELKHRESNAGSQSGKVIDGLLCPRTSRKSLVASSKSSVASSD